LNVQLLHRELYTHGVPSSRTPLFEQAIFKVLEGEPEAVVGKDDDGDDVLASQLLEAFGMNAEDYE
jgi:hypothetical protein